MYVCPYPLTLKLHHIVYCCFNFIKFFINVAQPKDYYFAFYYSESALMGIYGTSELHIKQVMNKIFRSKNYCTEIK